MANRPNLGEEDTIITENFPPMRDPSWDIIDDVPLMNLGRRGIPLFAPTGVAAWGILNLILTLLGVTYTIVLVFRALYRRKLALHGEQSANSAYIEGQGSDIKFGEGLPDPDGERVDKNLRPSWLAAAAAICIAGVLLFALTQDTTSLMVLLNNWTGAHAVLFAAQIVAVIFVFKRKKRS